VPEAGIFVEFSSMLPTNRVLGYFARMTDAKETGTAAKASASGKAFMDAMKDAGFEIPRLALAVGVDEETIRNYRAGKNKTRTKDFAKACEIIGADPDKILAGQFVRVEKGAVAVAEPPPPLPGPVQMLERLLTTNHHNTLVSMLSGLYRSEFGGDDR